MPPDRTLNRALVLGGVLLVALAIWAAPEARLAHAQPTPPAPAKSAPAAADSAPAAGAGADAQKSAPVAEITVGPHGVTVGRGDKKVRVGGVDSDGEFDSFDALVEQAPWLAGLVFFSVACVFAVPVLIVIAVVWYRMRRARMLNETMLKLAEKGVVPPASAFEALASNKAEAAERVLASAAPVAEQVRIASRRAAWSDLRKGIVMLGIGLGLSFFSILDDGTPNSVGLVLLFVGIGYIVLWRFEERRIAPPPGGGSASGT